MGGLPGSHWAACHPGLCSAGTAAATSWMLTPRRLPECNTLFPLCTSTPPPQVRVDTSRHKQLRITSNPPFSFSTPAPQAPSLLNLPCLLQLKVDTSRHERLHITFNLTFPALPCEALAMDVQDVSGKFQTDAGITHARCAAVALCPGLRCCDGLYSGWRAVLG